MEAKSPRIIIYQSAFVVRALRRTLQSYFAYYQRSRTHLALAEDTPESRAVEKPERGRIVVILGSEDFTTDISARQRSDALVGPSATIASVRRVNQSNLLAGRDWSSLCTPRFAIQNTVAALLQGSLDHFLQQRVSACRRGFR